MREEPPVKIMVPPNTPSPPLAREPPPIHAKVALLAAIPLRDEIAVPVEATPSAPTAPVVADAAPTPVPIAIAIGGIACFKKSFIKLSHLSIIC